MVPENTGYYWIEIMSSNEQPLKLHVNDKGDGSIQIPLHIKSESKSKL